ncbi:aspartate kinase [Flavobacteriaceae bacterium M23B6Z8]
MYPFNINLVLFGTGNVGTTFIEQLREASEFIRQANDIKLNLVAIANSKTLRFYEGGIFGNEDIITATDSYSIKDIVNFVQFHKLENLIAIDATASEELSSNYRYLISEGFNIVAANKIANTQPQAGYDRLRDELSKNRRSFKYETNVGAGLPVIETVKTLYECGDQITKIRGVFSGSLSYIFNTFCEADVSFSSVVRDALKKGYTEPDPRIDLSGKDVARKLLILAREINMAFEFEAIKIRSLLIPSLDEHTSLNWFLRNISELDAPFETAKITQKAGYVLRYVGELDVKRQTLEVKLVSVPKNSSLGQLKGTDSLFEVFTNSYGEEPLVVQGAGAGKEVTARGLLADTIKTAKEITKNRILSAF